MNIERWKKIAEYHEQNLKIYVNSDDTKYYIDIFSANVLGLITYEEATAFYDKGQTLFEIDKKLLEILKEIFKNKIQYEYLPSFNKEENKVF